MSVERNRFRDSFVDRSGENAPERYHCSNQNHCEIFSSSSSTKTSCRSCRFEKCLRIGMSIDGSPHFSSPPSLISLSSFSASRIGRQSNLFKERSPSSFSLRRNDDSPSCSIRQIQNSSMSMATVNDSARVASMAKKRKVKSKHQKSSSNRCPILHETSLPKGPSMHLEMPPLMNDFIALVHHSYFKFLKVSSPSSLMSDVDHIDIDLDPSSLPRIREHLVDDQYAIDPLCPTVSRLLSNDYSG